MLTGVWRVFKYGSGPDVRPQEEELMRSTNDPQFLIGRVLGPN